MIKKGERERERKREREREEIVVDRNDPDTSNSIIKK